MTGQDQGNGRWKLTDDFASSRYAGFFRELAGDRQLLDEAESLGYKIWFRVHPSFSEEAAAAFGLPDTVEIKGADMPYEEIVSRSALLVTDYSSAACDFAVLHKPVIYAQFDREEFFSGKHMVSCGTYDYETDGFGEVEYTEEDLAGRIIEYMRSDCRQKEEYRRRVEKFFRYYDSNHCSKIYTEIQ